MAPLVSTECVEVDDHRGGLAEEGQTTVLLQRSRQEAGLGEDLEAVADAEHRSAVGREARDGLHHRREARQGAGAQVVAVGEAPRQDDAVEAAEVGRGVPDELGLRAQLRNARDRVVLTVRAGEDNDADRVTR